MSWHRVIVEVTCGYHPLMIVVKPAGIRRVLAEGQDRMMPLPFWPGILAVLVVVRVKRMKILDEIFFSLLISLHSINEINLF